MRRRSPRPRIVTEALVVRRTPVGEADWILSLFTPTLGLVSAAARAARRPGSKLGVLEPLHGLEVELELTGGAEVAKLCQSKVVRPRLGILADPSRLDEAARLLRWVRSTVGAGAPEPGGFAVVAAALDALDRGEAPRAVSLGAGLGLLAALGYALELERCTTCGRRCPDDAPALLSPSAGGLVCRACGGAPIRVSARQRLTLVALASGEERELDDELLDVGARVVDGALVSHAARPAQPSGSGSR